MAQDKAVTNSTADKGIKVSPNRIKSLKGRLNSSQPKKRPVGRPSAMEYIDLDKLTEYASQPIENYKIAEALGISLTTFYRHMRENADFKLAYDAGIDNRKYELEKALYKRATGFEAQEVVTEKDNEGNIIKTKVTDKSYVPDTTAAIFALKNVYSEKYKDRIETITDININVNQIHQLSDDELAKIANANIIEALDYNIE
jgi:hypothetical protein